MRYLGLDIGTVRVGVALSDESGTIASPMTAVSAKAGFARMAAELKRICEEHDVGALVVGMPLSLSGHDRGESARLARRLGDQLSETLHIEVFYVDERFTTAQADRMLVGANVRRRARKNVVDKIAASLLLQSFLDSRGGHDL